MNNQKLNNISDNPSSERVLSAHNLSKLYPVLGDNAGVQVLDQLQLAVTLGEKVAIVGASGSGKTTLLNLLGGLDSPDAGEVWVSGFKLSHLSEKERNTLRNYHLGFVYQFHHLLGEFTAVENAAMPLIIRGMKREHAQRQAAELLAIVGLGGRLLHYPAQLSGGERQRVAIARALVHAPSCVLMDEPTGNLDAEAAAVIHDLMCSLNKQFNTSFIVVTHNVALAKSMDRQLRLAQGCLHEF